MYNRMFIASVAVDMPGCQQTVIGISHFEGGASTHIAERLEGLGFTPAQVGRILDRVRVSEMKRGQMGCTITLPGSLHQPFGRKA